MVKLINKKLFFVFLSIWVSSCGNDLKFRGDDKVKDYSADQMPVVVKEFSPATFEESSLTVNPDVGVYESTFSFRLLDPSETGFTQITRPQRSKVFIQGNDGMSVNEIFSIKRAGSLDLLVVIDNSSSMENNQQNLGDKLSDLILNIANTNWQIGVVTTDSSCLRDLITRDEFEQDPDDVKRRFSVAINAGGNGSGWERGIEFAIKGLNATGCSSGNVPWVRQNSSVAVLIVSDESNCGSEGVTSCENAGFTNYTPDDFIASTPSDIKVFGLLYDRVSCGDNGFNPANDPFSYYDLVSRTSGFWEPICQPDYTSVLQRISAEVEQELKKDFILEKEPENIESILVDSNPITQNDYEINGKILLLKEDNIPSNAQELSISYRYGAIPKYKDFVFNPEDNPDPRSISVTIDGTHSNAYTYDEQTKTLAFNHMPPNDSEIKVIYHENDPLTSSLNISDEEILEDSITVKVDGKEYKDYELQNNVITFNPPPLDGKKVSVYYNKPSDIISRYPVGNINLDQIGDIELKDVITSDSVPFKIKNGQFVIPEDEVRIGRKVKAIYRKSEDIPNAIIKLPFDPVPGSVNIKYDKNIYKCNEDIKGADINFNCNDYAPDSIEITYLRVIDFINEFNIKEQIDENAIWQVWIDDKEITDFIVNGNNISIPPEKLNINSKIKVQISPNPDAPPVLKE